ncbi:MAG: TolC family protein [Bacteroidota bacterium]
MINKIKSPGIWMLLILVVSALSSFAQQPKSITLREAINLGLTNSHLLKNQQAKIEEATAAVKEATERKLPDFKVSGSYLYLPFKPNIQMKSDSAGNGGGGPNVNQVVYGSANVSVPIFTGGKLKYAIQSAKYLEEASKLDAEENRDAVILNIVNAYANLYKAESTVALVNENLLQANQRVKDFTNLEKNGLLPRNDLLKAELQSSNAELMLLDAESNFKITSVNMALMLGLPEQSVLKPDSASLQPGGTIVTMEEYEQTALAKRTDISALALRKKAAELGIQSVRAEYYPNLALTGGYVAAHIPGFLTVTNAVNVGVGVQYNLSSLWKTKSKISQAEARAKQITASQDQLNDETRMKVNRAYQEYLVSQKKIQVYRKAVEQAQENYRITKNKYDNALATTTDLLDADIAQLQTKLNVSNATADAVVAYNRLLQTAGIINN